MPMSWLIDNLEWAFVCLTICFWAIGFAFVLYIAYQGNKQQNQHRALRAQVSKLILANQRVAVLEEENGRLNACLDRMQQDNDDKRVQLAKIQTERNELSAQVSTLQTESGKLRSENKELHELIKPKPKTYAVNEDGTVTSLESWRETHSDNREP